MKLPVIKPVAAAVGRAVTARRGWGTGSSVFNSGLWNHATATASGGSQILGTNRYRIYSAAGAISQVTVPGILVSGRAYQFQLTFETPVLGTQIQVGDAGANVDDFVSSLAGTRTVAFVADGTTATLKRPYVVSAGQPTDVVVKNIAVTDITATALVITSQPSPTAVVDGSAATFSVAVAAPFSAIHYSWEVSTDGGSSWAVYSGGSGAITNTLTTAAMTTADNGELFRCRIRMGSSTNTTGQIYSATAALTVTEGAPAISGVTGTIAHGQTITVTGSGLGQSPTLLRIRGDEGTAGTSVATATGMTVHGTTGNEWLFEAGGTMVLDMQAAAPKTVYKWFGGTAYKDAFLYYERQHFDVGALNPSGNGQVKESRFSGADAIGEHSDDPELGTVWDVESSTLYRFCGYAGQLNLGGVNRAIMTAWSSQLVAGRIVGANAVGDYEIYGDGFTSRTLNDTAPAPDTKGYGQIFLPFYRSPDFSTSMRMRNYIALAGRQRLEVRNSSNPELANRVVVQYATAASATSATLQLDLTRFAANDGLYLFAVNANGEYSAAHELRAPTAPDTYNPLTDNYGVIRPTFNGSTGVITVPDYSAAAAAADSLRFQVGFIVDGLDAGTAGTPIGVCLSSSTNQYRGHLRADHTNGAISIRSMANNTGLTLAASSDVHTDLGSRRDWELIVPKNTGELITLTDMQAESPIGSVARTSTFDGFYPTKWMYCNLLAAQGALKGRVAYLRCFATTGGVEATLFDFRFTAEQAGLTSVPSAHDAGVVATIGSALTWGVV